MLSVIVYGRNDQHGANLHRRAALSLNALAAVLGEDDEIVFADMLSPEAAPSFPEAIDDLLTERALARLRVIRVRERDLAALNLGARHIPEALARNLAARRTANPWLLFTNTDVLLAEPAPGALRAALASAEGAFYQAPRSELPQHLWEMLPRDQPASALAFLIEHGARLGLVQRVLSEARVLYDNPGDFQLVRREAFAAIAGFDESMTRPFHVDANLAVRLRLHLGAIGSFEAATLYHCDHARSVTRMNSREEESNDFARYVTSVTEAAIAEQGDAWGLAGQDLEEIVLKPPLQRLAAYLETQPAAPARVIESRYDGASFNSLDYDPETISHFVADRLCTLPPGAEIGWIGADARLLAATRTRLEGLGRRLSPLVCGPLAGQPLPWGESAEPMAAIARGQVLVVAFGAEGVARFRDYARPPASFAPDAAELEQLDIAGLLRLAALAAPAGKRLVLVNAINNEFERMARQWVDGALAPFATRLRDGVLAPTTPLRLRLRDLALAAGVHADASGVTAPEGHRGDIVVGGPYFDLAPALYRVTLAYRLPKPGLPLLRLKLDLMAFGEPIATIGGLAAHAQGELGFDFEIAPAFLAKRGIAPLEIRVSGNGRAEFVIESVRIERKGALSLPLEQIAAAHRLGAAS
jgi:hypothetical protein